MKSVLKLFLVVVLCGSTIFAEGEMGSTGRNCPNGQTTCFAPDSSEQSDPEETNDETEDTVLTTVEEYFDWVFKYFESQE